MGANPLNYHCERQVLYCQRLHPDSTLSASFDLWYELGIIKGKQNFFLELKGTYSSIVQFATSVDWSLSQWGRFSMNFLASSAPLLSQIWKFDSLILAVPLLLAHFYEVWIFNVCVVKSLQFLTFIYIQHVIHMLSEIYLLLLEELDITN